MNVLLFVTSLITWLVFAYMFTVVEKWYERVACGAIGLANLYVAFLCIEVATK